MRYVLVATLLGIGVASAQVPAAGDPPSKKVTVHDERALELLDAMSAKVYKPRNRGLATIAFKVVLSSKVGDQVKSSQPLHVKWSASGTLDVADHEGKAVDPQRIGSVVDDVIGHETGKRAREHHIDLMSEREIRFRVPSWVTNSPISHMMLHLDERGLLTKQELFRADNKVVQSIVYTYAPHGDEFVIATREYHNPARAARGPDGKPMAIPPTVSRQTYAYGDVEGFYLVRRIVTETFDASGDAPKLMQSRMIDYSDHEPVARSK